MLEHFYTIIKKDIKLMISSKFFIMTISSLILFSLYINFVYSKLDTPVDTIYLFDPENKIKVSDENIISVESPDELQKELENNKNEITIDYSQETPHIMQYETGIPKLDNFKRDNALKKITVNTDYDNINYLSSDSRELKLRMEMTCEIIFFEIVTVGFLGIASLLFKEKQMGVMKIHSILPIEKNLFIISKLFVFLVSDIVFAFLAIFININTSTFLSIFTMVLPHIAILSLIMALLGFLLTMIYKNFKQFGFASAFIIILMTSPVYLAANTVITFKWIRFYPVYHLYMSMKNAFFKTTDINIFYYFICIFSILLLFKFACKKMDKYIIGG